MLREQLYILLSDTQFIRCLDNLKPLHRQSSLGLSIGTFRNLIHPAAGGKNRKAINRIPCLGLRPRSEPDSYRIVLIINPDTRLAHLAAVSLREIEVAILYRETVAHVQYKRGPMKFILEGNRCCRLIPHPCLLNSLQVHPEKPHVLFHECNEPGFSRLFINRYLGGNAAAVTMGKLNRRGKLGVRC